MAGEEKNDFNRVAAIEEARTQADAVRAIVLELRDINKKLNEVRAENKLIRQEMRNIGNLRPLKK